MTASRKLLKYPILMCLPLIPIVARHLRAGLNQLTPLYPLRLFRLAGRFCPLVDLFDNRRLFRVQLRGLRSLWSTSSSVASALPIIRSMIIRWRLMRTGGALELLRTTYPSTVNHDISAKSASMSSIVASNNLRPSSSVIIDALYHKSPYLSNRKMGWPDARSANSVLLIPAISDALSVG